jgi:hypothetical protein
MRKNDMQISTISGANIVTSYYLKDLMQSENNYNTNKNIKTSKINENINYDLNNINNGKIKYNMSSHINNLKINQNDKNITQNKLIGQNIIKNGFNNLNSFDPSKETISTRNFNGKKFLFSDNNEIDNNKISEEKQNNQNKFTKIGKDKKLSTKHIDNVKNIFSSKIAEN